MSGKLEARLQPWLVATLAGLNSGVRRENAECIIAIFNITTQGVLSLHKQQFLLQQVTSMAHAYGKSFIAVIIMANRAGDMRGSTASTKQLVFVSVWDFESIQYQHFFKSIQYHLACPRHLTQVWGQNWRWWRIRWRTSGARTSRTWRYGVGILDFGNWVLNVYKDKKYVVPLYHHHNLFLDIWIPNDLFYFDLPRTIESTAANIIEHKTLWHNIILQRTSKIVSFKQNGWPCQGQDLAVYSILCNG